MTASSRWDDARRILCVRLDSLGDVLMTTPAIRAVKVARPDRHITLLTSANSIVAECFERIGVTAAKLTELAVIAEHAAPTR